MLVTIPNEYISNLVTISLHNFVRYGEERYEKKEMQQRVRQRFSQLQAMDERDGQVPWYVVNAAQSIEEVQKEIKSIVEKTVERVNSEERPLGILWQSEQCRDNKEN
jgi:LAS superfamily LD-carboxypeptidase LdcB